MVIVVTILLMTLFFVGCSSEETDVQEATEMMDSEVEVVVDVEEVEVVTAEVPTEEVEESNTNSIGSTIVFSEMEITFNSAELYVKDNYNSYVAVSVHLNNLKSVQNYIGGSTMTITNEAGEIVSLELFDVEEYNNIVTAKPMQGETADAFILIATKEAGSYIITFDDPYKDDDEPIIVNIDL